MKLRFFSKKINLIINQLYHPTGKFKQDSFNEVHSKDEINRTKFIQILLKEWFYLLKRDGFLVIDYQSNKICNKEKLEQTMKWLWGGKYKIISHDYISKKRLRFICKKTVSTKIAGDDITKWTFGIITNGKREQWINKIIESIRKQKIPHYEIIICGTYLGKIGLDIKYVHFNKRDNKGWITKKKNLIVKKAKFENICMLHDRIILDKDWYKGMKKWGNCFENLGCQQLFEVNRVNDWIASHYFVDNKHGEKFSFESYVDYKDWYPTIFFLGQLNIFKKSLIVKNNLWWDEDLYYGQREDFHFSNELHRKGFIHRLNNLAKVYTLTNKYVSPTFIKYNPLALNPQMELNNINAYLKAMTYFVLRIFDFAGINFSHKALEDVRGRIYTFILMFNPKKYSYNREWKKAIKV